MPRARPSHLLSILQRPALAVAILAAVVGGGTLGYMIIEGWSAWDAFYMTAITVTTVGYREVHDLSPAGQAFTVVLLFGGVGAALYYFTILFAVMVEGGLPKRLGQRRLSHMLDNLTDHFIVCGYGRIGSIVAAELGKQRVPFVVIERDPDRVHRVIEQGGVAVDADASGEEVLTRVGIARARGLIAAVGTDAENVYTILTARGLRPDLFIIARAESDDAVRKMLRAGANRVISPYQIGGIRMAQTALRPAVVDFVELATSSEHLELTMEQIEIADASALAGHSVIDANLRQRFGVIVVGIQRRDGQMEFNPSPDALMAGGDKLVVLGRAEGLKQLDLAAHAR